MVKEFCHEHCETQHTLYGDGKSNPGLVADYYEFKAYVNAVINKFLGGACVVGFVWAFVETILKLHGK